MRSRLRVVDKQAPARDARALREEAARKLQKLAQAAAAGVNPAFQHAAALAAVDAISLATIKGLEELLTHDDDGDRRR